MRQLLHVDLVAQQLAHLYRLSSAGNAHILGAFPPVFPEDAAGRARKAGLLAVVDELQRMQT